jgi:AbrB family looped-hinge helix DNA binding protein
MLDDELSDFLTAGGCTVPLVKVKEKYQVTLPAAVRMKAGVTVGDLLEAKVRGKKITLTPKRVIDREIALALEDFKKGRFIGPFRTAEAAIRALRRAAK